MKLSKDLLTAIAASSVATAVVSIAGTSLVWHLLTKQDPKTSTSNPTKVPTKGQSKNTSAIKEEINPLDDTKTYILHVPSAEASSSRSPTIVVRCNAKSSDFYVVTFDFLGTGLYESPKVSLRFDGAKAVNQSWNEGQGSMGAVFSRSPLTHLDQLSKANTLVFGWRPYGQNLATASFPVTPEIRSDLEKMKTHCR
jgi:hypothetical protein